MLNEFQAICAIALMVIGFELLSFPSAGRTDRAGAASGRGNHATSASCLPKPPLQGPEEHVGSDRLQHSDRSDK